MQGVGGSFLRIRNATLKFVGSSNTAREDGSLLPQFSELGKCIRFPLTSTDWSRAEPYRVPFKVIDVGGVAFSAPQR